MMKMKLGIALTAILALAAIAAGSASAAATTTAAQIYTGPSPGTTLPVGTSKAVNFKLTGTATLKSLVGTSGTPIDLEATEAECVGCKLENKAITSKTPPVAFGSGRILFKSVVVTEPAHCKAVSSAGVDNQVLTAPLNVHADFMNGSTAVQQFVPVSGTSFAPFELENNGGTCAAAGLYNVTGTLFTNAANPTGTFAVSQSASTSPAINTADGGALTIGSKPAELTATGDFELASKEEWAIK